MSPGKVRFGISAQSTDEDTIDRVISIIGGGKSGPAVHGGNAPIWQWWITRRADAIAVMEAVRPHMSARRQAQIDHALKAHREHPVRPYDDSLPQLELTT